MSACTIGAMAVRRRWKIEAAVVALILAITAALTQVRPAAGPGSIVEEVVDGDTIRLSDGQKVRYLLVDTPEKGDLMYEEAVSANRDLVKGRPARLELDARPRDDYGRTLAYVFVKDAQDREIFVNAELVRQGFALLYVVGENEARRDEILAAQRDAAQARRGLWAHFAADDAGGPFVGGKGKSARHRFHRTTCDTLEDRKGLETFATKRDALLDGRSPCRKCKP